MRVIIADSQYLVREGLKSLLKYINGITDVEEVQNNIELHSVLSVSKSLDLVIIDFDNHAFNARDIQYIKSSFNQAKIIAITPNLNKHTILQAIKNGVDSYLLKECDKKEVMDAIKATIKGEQFYCGKIVETVLNDEDVSIKDIALMSCEPVLLSEREIEVVKLIASGLTNQEMAEQLYLSGHTVNTHRKNIMKKLEVRNTAGIIMYAIKEKLIETGV